MWNFCPSLDAAYTLVVLFAITTVAHFIQAVVHKKAYCWVIIMSGTTQTLAYFFRILSILSPASFSDYAAWFILILLAPLFTNAFIYMMIGRMVWSYIPGPEYYEVQLGGLKCISLPWMLGKLSYDKWNPSINGTWQDFNYTGLWRCDCSGSNETKQEVLRGLSPRFLMKCTDFIRPPHLYDWRRYSTRVHFLILVLRHQIPPHYSFPA